MQKKNRNIRVSSLGTTLPLVVGTFGLGVLPAHYGTVPQAVAQTAMPVAAEPTPVLPLPPGVAGAPLTQPVLTPPPEPSPGLADARNQVGENVAPLTLEDAIALALINNPQRDAAIAALQAARARIGTARSAGGLQVGAGANAGFDRSFGSRGTSNNNSGGNAGGSRVFGFEATQSISTTADLPLYTGGRVKAGRRVAEAGARFQAAQTLQLEQDLVLSTITTYLDVLRTGQLLDVAEGNLAVSRERRRVEQVRYDAGASARLDVLRADTTLADSQQRRIAASNNWAQSKAALNTLMGRVPEAPLRTETITNLTPRVPLPPEITGNQATPVSGAPAAAGTALVPGPTTVAAKPGSSADLRAIAAGQRPALASGQAQVEAGEAGIDLARAQRKPSIGLSLTGLLRNPVTFAGRFALGLGLSVAQTLFDSGRARSQIDEARALADQSRANLGNQQLNVANEIEQALLSLDSAQKRLASADVSVVAAVEALRAAQLGYQAGARTRLEVSDAQVALLTAQTDAVNARFEVADAQANLSAGVGVLTVEGQNAYQRALTEETSRAQTVAAQQVQPKPRRKKFLGIF